jgi:hypothetical protein
VDDFWPLNQINTQSDSNIFDCINEQRRPLRHKLFDNALLHLYGRVLSSTTDSDAHAFTSHLLRMVYTGTSCAKWRIARP